MANSKPTIVVQSAPKSVVDKTEDFAVLALLVGGAFVAITLAGSAAVLLPKLDPRAILKGLFNAALGPVPFDRLGKAALGPLGEVSASDAALATLGPIGWVIKYFEPGPPPPILLRPMVGWFFLLGGDVYQGGDPGIIASNAWFLSAELGSLEDYYETLPVAQKALITYDGGSGNARFDTFGVRASLPSMPFALYLTVPPQKAGFGTAADLQSYFWGPYDHVPAMVASGVRGQIQAAYDLYQDDLGILDGFIQSGDARRAAVIENRIWALGKLFAIRGLITLEEDRAAAEKKQQDELQRELEAVIEMQNQAPIGHFSASDYGFVPTS